MAIDTSTFAMLGVSALAILWFGNDLATRRKVRHPPSPRSFPIIGNLLSIPPGQDHIAYTTLGKQLNSDIIYLEMLGLQMVVVNSAKTASELLDHRSAIYSERPSPPMVMDPALLNWSNFPGMLGHNELWRHYRRMMNNWLNIREVKQFHDLQEHESKLLLMRLLDVSSDPQPFDRVKHELFFSTGSIMFRLAYGYPLQSAQDPFFIDAVAASHHLFDSCMYPNFLVNIFPMLSRIPSWLPGMHWKRTAQKWRQCKERALNKPYEWTKAQVATGRFEPSVLSALLQGHDLVAGLTNEEKDERLKQLAIILFFAGTDTTSTAILNFVVAMVMNPQVQARAQQEIDLLLGDATRLPVMSDRDKLPYVRNLVSEVMRWRPVGPTGGPPHVCLEDNIYRGYSIQKGTVIIGNLWAMSRDESIYPNAEEFDPNRYIDPDVPVVPGFGWGRRKCPGLHFAEDSMFIVMASLLATFTFSKKKDQRGREITPSLVDAANSLAMELQGFEFEFKPRSTKHRQLIEDAVQPDH